MNERETQFVGAFMESFRRCDSNKRAVPFQLENKKGWKGKIEDRVEVQLSLCTLAMALRQQGLTTLAMSSISNAIQTKGAVEFFAEFLVELSRANLGHSIIGNNVAQENDNIEIAAHDLHLIHEHNMAFKAELHRLIDSKGGVTLIARRTGLSQPSLSKMLNSDSVPRSSTIAKLFEALNITSILIKRKETKQKK